MFKFKGRFLALLLAVLLMVGSMPVLVLGDDSGVDVGSDVGVLDEIDDNDSIDTDVDENASVETNVISDGCDDETNIYADYCLESLIENLTGEISAPLGLENVVMLTFDPNGGTPGQETMPAIAGSLLESLPQQPTKAGFVFVGWFTDTSIPSPNVNFTGARIAHGSVVPSANATYWARWVRPLRIGYDNLVSVNSPAIFTQVDNIVSEIKPLFDTYFGVRFEQEMPAHYEPRLNFAPPLSGGVGTRDAANILDYMRSNNSTVRFRFVDFPIFSGDRRLHGMGRSWQGVDFLGEAIVYLNELNGAPLTHERFRYIVVHEISHVLGSHDCLGNASHCVMSDRFHVYNNWCNTCRNTILSYVWRVGENSFMAHLLIREPELTPTPIPTPVPVAGVSSWGELYDAINSSQPGVETVIHIEAGFNAFTNVQLGSNRNGFTIAIPPGRHIMLVSDNTAVSADYVRTITMNLNNAHFIVSAGSTLTLGQNIILRGANNAGGVLVNGGGELIMNPGSEISGNRLASGVRLEGSGADEATRARLTMTGGVIGNNRGPDVGGVYIGANSIMAMSGDSEISHNTAAPIGGVHLPVAGGVLLSTPTSVLEMRDNATIQHHRQAVAIQHNATLPGVAGGVLMLGGYFTMYGGNLSYNTITGTPGHGGSHGGSGVRVARGVSI